ncbi:hypothetical protein UMM65_01825 [Aureibaculum sp. 2210JD6-5]|uniref:TapB family protein n=1 Tax=Aureibaculum sp. 2210JD6-5 TaxID=3103957 RepID=UPI002AACA978|nr:hypothetical protein [Aureibaculum sp. 2210JD6-5]MDY7393966.1 hypothetical protein [Aureibaculum sp. 2210JD6-5]
MKKIILGVTLLFTLQIVAQDCDFLILNEGVTLEYTQFDKKGKETSKSTHKTKNISNQDGKVTALINMTTATEKEETFSSEYKVSCTEGMIAIDMIRFFDSSQISSYNSDDFTVEMQGDILEFPSTMEVGTNLNDGSITVKVFNNDLKIVTVTMDITNRKIVGNEKITTSAGTFDCTKLSYDFESKIGFIKVKGSGVEWHSEDKAIVKSESYNKKGKLIGSQELTKIIK